MESSHPPLLSSCEFSPEMIRSYLNQCFVGEAMRAVILLRLLGSLILGKKLLPTAGKYVVSTFVRFPSIVG